MEGFHSVLSLARLILEKADEAKEFKQDCLELAKKAECIKNTVEKVKTRVQHPHVQQALAVIKSSLEEAYKIVNKCTKSSRVYAFVWSGTLRHQLERATDNLNLSLALFPLILVDVGEDNQRQVMSELTAMCSHLEYIIRQQQQQQQLAVAMGSDVTEVKNRLHKLATIRRGKDSKAELDAEVQRVGCCWNPEDRKELVDQLATCTIEELQQEALSEPPESYVCPISLQVMEDPVILQSGQIFDRASISKWFAEGKTTCPLAGHAVDPNIIIPMFEMKSRIQDWKRSNGVPQSGQAAAAITPPSSSPRPARANTLSLGPSTTTYTAGWEQLPALKPVSSASQPQGVPHSIRSPPQAQTYFDSLPGAPPTKPLDCQPYPDQFPIGQLTSHPLEPPNTNPVICDSSGTWVSTGPSYATYAEEQPLISALNHVHTQESTQVLKAQLVHSSSAPGLGNFSVASCRDLTEDDDFFHTKGGDQTRRSRSQALPPLSPIQPSRNQSLDAFNRSSLIRRSGEGPQQGPGVPSPSGRTGRNADRPLTALSAENKTSSSTAYTMTMMTCSSLDDDSDGHPFW